MRTEPSQRLVLSVEEVAELLGISRSTAYEAVHQGVIPSLRFGRVIRVPRASLERLLCGENQDKDLDEVGT